MKKVLILVCVLMLILSIGTYAANYEETYSKAVEISTALGTSDNIEEPLGEAVVLMIEDDILKTLKAMGELERAAELKECADIALTASAKGESDARQKAIAFSDKLLEAVSLTSVNFVTNGYFADGLNGWTETASVSIYNDSETYGLTLPALQIKGKQSNGVTSDSITDLTAEKSYRLSMDVVNVSKTTNFSILTTVEYGTHDGTAFTSLGKCVDGIRLYGNTDDTKKTVVQDFNLPAGANAVRVSIQCKNSGGASTVTLVDDIELKEADKPIEMVKNGSVDAAFSAGETNYSSVTGWKTKSTGTVSSTIERDLSSGNSYMKMYGKNTVAYWRQNITLRHGKVYKLSFKFSQSGLGDNVSPNVGIDILNENAVDISPVFIGCPSTDTITWKNYEALITVDKPGEGYVNELVDATLIFSTLSDKYWVDGGIMYYDDISLVEIDADTQIGFAVSENGEFTTEPAEAMAASCIFVQGETPAIQKFVVAKYNGTTHALESATIVNAGEGISAGNAKRYDVPLDECNAASYYRIFLWDGKTLTPVLDSQKIG